MSITATKVHKNCEITIIYVYFMLQYGIDFCRFGIIH